MNKKREKINLLSDFGEVPVDLLKRAQALDENCIKKWTKLAVQSESFEELRQKLDV